MPSPGDLSNPGLKPTSPALTGGFYTSVPLGKPLRLGPTFFIGLMSRNSNLSLAFMNIALESLDCFISLQSSHASSSSFFFLKQEINFETNWKFCFACSNNSGLAQFFYLEE